MNGRIGPEQGVRIPGRVFCIAEDAVDGTFGDVAKLHDLGAANLFPLTAPVLPDHFGDLLASLATEVREVPTAPVFGARRAAASARRRRR